jgi:hypothetical protein
MLKCQYCEKDLKNQGAKNLHERKCAKNPNRVVDISKNECGKGGMHEWRLLNKNIVAEKTASLYGMKEVCEKCTEVR